LLKNWGGATYYPEVVAKISVRRAGRLLEPNG